MNRKKKYIKSGSSLRDDKKTLRRFLSLYRQRMARNERASSTHKLDELNKFNNSFKPYLEA